MSTTEDRHLDLEPGVLGIDLFSTGDGNPLVVLAGEIDAATVGRLDACLRAVVEGGATAVALDLADVTFMDSSGINAVLDLRRRLPPDGRVSLLGCRHQIRRVCEITGLVEAEGIVLG